MEFFPSGSLRLRLQAKDFEFIKEHSRKIFKEAATGLAYMNARGYVHRDVKPDNILVNAVGDAKIIDFAIAQQDPERAGAGGSTGRESRRARRASCARSRSRAKCRTAGPTSTATAARCTS